MYMLQSQLYNYIIIIIINSRKKRKEWRVIMMMSYYMGRQGGCCVIKGSCRGSPRNSILHLRFHISSKRTIFLLSFQIYPFVIVSFPTKRILCITLWLLSVFFFFCVESFQLWKKWICLSLVCCFFFCSISILWETQLTDWTDLLTGNFIWIIGGSAVAIQYNQRSLANF